MDLSVNLKPNYAYHFFDKTISAHGLTWSKCCSGMCLPTIEVYFYKCVFKSSGYIIFPPNIEVSNFRDCIFDSGCTIIMPKSSCVFDKCSFGNESKIHLRQIEHVSVIDCIFDCHGDDDSVFFWGEATWFYYRTRDNREYIRFPRISNVLTICDNSDPWKSRPMILPYGCDIFYNMDVGSPTEIIWLLEALCMYPRMHVTTDHQFHEVNLIEECPSRCARSVILLMLSSSKIVNSSVFYKLKPENWHTCLLFLI